MLGSIDRTMRVAPGSQLRDAGPLHVGRTGRLSTSPHQMSCQSIYNAELPRSISQSFLLRRKNIEVYPRPAMNPRAAIEQMPDELKTEPFVKAHKPAFRNRTSRL